MALDFVCFRWATDGVFENGGIEAPMMAAIAIQCILSDYQDEDAVRERLCEVQALLPTLPSEFDLVVCSDLKGVKKHLEPMQAQYMLTSLLTRAISEVDGWHPLVLKIYQILIDRATQCLEGYPVWALLCEAEKELRVKIAKSYATAYGQNP